MPCTAVAVRAVETLLRELEAADRFSGVVGVEQGDQKLLLEAFGYASRTWSIPTTVETRFDTASITKLFNGVSGMLRHYPTKDITFAVLAVGEHAAWGPVKAIDEAVGNL